MWNKKLHKDVIEGKLCAKWCDCCVGLKNSESESKDNMWNKKLHKDVIEGKLRAKWCDHCIGLKNSESESKDEMTVHAYVKESNVRRY